MRFFCTFVLFLLARLSSADSQTVAFQSVHESPKANGLTEGERIAVVVNNARLKLAEHLERDVLIQVSLGDTPRSAVLVSAAARIQETVSNVKHEYLDTTIISSATVEFTYSSSDVAGRIAHEREVGALRSDLAHARSVNAAIAAGNVDAAQLARGNVAAISQNNKAHAPNLVYETQAELAGLASRSLGGVGKGAAFIQAYLPALRDSLEVSYYDVMPVVEGGRSFAVVDLTIDIARGATPLIETIPLLPEYYLQRSEFAYDSETNQLVRDELCGRDCLLNIELHDVGLKSFVGGHDATLTSSKLDTDYRCKSAVNGVSIAQIKLERDYPTDGTHGRVFFGTTHDQSALYPSGKRHSLDSSGAEAACSVGVGHVPSVVIAAAMMGKLKGMLYWEELDFGVTINLSEGGALFPQKSRTYFLDVEPNDIPLLQTVKFITWIEGQDQRPPLYGNTTVTVKKDDPGKRWYAALRNRLDNRRANSSYPEWALDDRQYDYIAKIERTPYKFKKRHAEQFVRWDRMVNAVYLNQDLPPHHQRDNEHKLNPVMFRVSAREYEYQKDLSEELIYTQDFSHAVFNAAGGVDEYARRRALANNALVMSGIKR